MNTSIIDQILCEKMNNLGLETKKLHMLFPPRNEIYITKPELYFLLQKVILRYKKS